MLNYKNRRSMYFLIDLHETFVSECNVFISSTSTLFYNKSVTIIHLTHVQMGYSLHNNLL